MKGQISLDLMMAVLITLLLLTTFFVVADDIKENYKEIFIENQLKKISSETAASITSSSAMQGLEFETKISVPLIQYESNKYKPVINLDNNLIEASITLGGRTITYSSRYSPPQKTNIRFDEETMMVVIKSE